ncbi:MAG: hypothetical protein K1060chlam5_01302, partial [Candidatus Anoxychlamydiales bacterium]|nr:hypothetical protein [Candidatus Anoxychlamydiales bacterium]
MVAQVTSPPAINQNIWYGYEQNNGKIYKIAYPRETQRKIKTAIEEILRCKSFQDQLEDTKPIADPFFAKRSIEVLTDTGYKTFLLNDDLKQRLDRLFRIIATPPKPKEEAPSPLLADKKSDKTTQSTQSISLDPSSSIPNPQGSPQPLSQSTDGRILKLEQEIDRLNGDLLRNPSSSQVSTHSQTDRLAPRLPASTQTQAASSNEEQREKIRLQERIRELEEELQTLQRQFGESHRFQIKEDRRTRTFNDANRQYADRKLREAQERLKEADDVVTLANKRTLEAKAEVRRLNELASQPKHKKEEAKEQEIIDPLKSRIKQLQVRIDELENIQRHLEHQIDEKQEEINRAIDLQKLSSSESLSSFRSEKDLLIKALMEEIERLREKLADNQQLLDKLTEEKEEASIQLIDLSRILRTTDNLPSQEIIAKARESEESAKRVLEAAKAMQVIAEESINAAIAEAEEAKRAAATLAERLDEVRANANTEKDEAVAAATRDAEAKAATTLAERLDEVRANANTEKDEA